MEFVIIVSTIVKLILAGAAFVCVVFGLRYLDKISGFNFKERVKNADDNSIAIYMGFRIFAVCYLIGSIISG